jgi:hypothetical protein
MAHQKGLKTEKAEVVDGKYEECKLCFTTGKKICREIESNGKGGFYLVKDGSKRVISIGKVDQGDTI